MQDEMQSNKPRTSRPSRLSRWFMAALPEDEEGGEDDGFLLSAPTPAPPKIMPTAHRRRSAWEITSPSPMTTLPHFEPTPQAQEEIQEEDVREQRSQSMAPSAMRDMLTFRRGSSATASKIRRNTVASSFVKGGGAVDFSPKPLDLTDLKTIGGGGGGGLKTIGDDKPTTLSPIAAPKPRLSRAALAHGEEVLMDDLIGEMEEEEPTPLWLCIMYGLINATIVLPVVMTFGNIIYRDEYFIPYSAVLVKLCVISGIVHQLAFCTFSSLPFAVGSVQDAGLIFLSSMASDIVKYGQERDATPEQILATATIGLALCTALLGLGLVGIGWLGLASYVQHLPPAVVGGYLAFIGWFCGISGVGIMAETEPTLSVILSDKWVFIVPGVLGGIIIYVSVRTLRHLAVLPSLIAFEIILFYVILWITGTSLEEATEKGWVRHMDAPPPLLETWTYLRFDLVMWGVVPRLIFSEVSMIFVVALSSSLDVAAIDLELKQEHALDVEIKNEKEGKVSEEPPQELEAALDYNRELSTVGWSNLISGLTGGYTGSYIFSQTIFTLRSGVQSRSAGLALAAAQFVTVVVPYPILAAVPSFFFGSLLTMICVDLMVEWLWEVRARLSTGEYMIALATFALIQVLKVEFGILAGIALYFVCCKMGFLCGGKETVDEEDGEDGENGENVPLDGANNNKKGDYGSTYNQPIAE